METSTLFVKFLKLTSHHGKSLNSFNIFLGVFSFEIPMRLPNNKCSIVRVILSSSSDFLCEHCFLIDLKEYYILSYWVQFSSVAQSCPTLCDPMNHSTPGLLVHHQLLEFTQTHIQWVSDAVQSSHPLLSSSPPAPSPSQHQGLFKWVKSSHEVAKVLEFQL